MCFLIAEGYYHTSNLWRYMKRLFVMAVISHVPFALCFGYNVWAFWQATDVLWALLLGLIALTIYHRKDWGMVRKLIGIGVCCLLAYPADWNYIAVLMVLLFGIFHGEKNPQTASHIAVTTLYELQALAYSTSVLAKLGILFSIPLLRRYNGQRGPKSKLIQWGFYWFLPHPSACPLSAQPIGLTPFLILVQPSGKVPGGWIFFLLFTKDRIVSPLLRILFHQKKE